MSKNKYRLPFNGTWYTEYGGTKKSNSHSYDLISQRYAYDFEIRVNDLPYHDDCTECSNYYSYLEDIICPCDGFVVDIKNDYDNTHITSDRKVINDNIDPRGNYITISHSNGEYSYICHIEKNSFLVKIGDIVHEGDRIAKVGNSGNTQGPHIHYQVQKGIDFNSGIGVKISFKNTYCGIRKIKYIEKTMSVHSK